MDGATMTTIESSSPVLGQPEAPFTLDADPGRHHHDLRVPGVLVHGPAAIAEFGIGLAAAVGLDAFVLRTVLAAMHLFGDANWWLPPWRDRRLPHLAIEPPGA
jgi:hypothetical protein